MEILFALEALGEMSVTEIADDLAVSREQISRSVSFFGQRRFHRQAAQSGKAQCNHPFADAKGSDLLHDQESKVVEDLRGRLSVLDGPEKEAFIGASRKAALAIKKVFGLKKKEIQESR